MTNTDPYILVNITRSRQGGAGYNHRVSLQLNVSQLPRASCPAGSYSSYIMRNMKDNSQQSFPPRREPDRARPASQHFLHYPAAGRGPVKSQSIIQQLFYHLENNNQQHGG